MTSRRRVLLELPSEGEVTRSEEVRTLPNEKLIRRTIQYQDGVVAILILNFENKVFSVRLKPTNQPFALSGNRIIRPE